MGQEAQPRTLSLRSRRCPPQADQAILARATCQPAVHGSSSLHLSRLGPLDGLLSDLSHPSGRQSTPWGSDLRLKGLYFSKCCMRPRSTPCDTDIPHTSHVCTCVQCFPRQDTNCCVGETTVLPHRMQGSPGPKSGRCSSIAGRRPLSSLGLLLLHMHAARATTTSHVRVPLASQVSGEAGRSIPVPRQAPVKPLRTQDATCRSPQPSLQRQRIVKRSLQRVHRRILRTGGAWYKGKWYDQDTASALTNRLYRQSTSSDARSNMRPRHQLQHMRSSTPTVSHHSCFSHHLQVYAWNVGGLGGACMMRFCTTYTNTPWIS